MALGFHIRCRVPPRCGPENSNPQGTLLCTKPSSYGKLDNVHTPNVERASLTLQSFLLLLLDLFPSIACRPTVELQEQDKPTNTIYKAVLRQV